MHAPCHLHPLPCTPSTTHTPYHACPLPCTLPTMHTPYAMHAPLPCMHSLTICLISGSDDDACASSPCGNGAICHDLLSGYICECAENYYGKNCEKRVSDTQGCPDITTKAASTTTAADAASTTTMTSTEAATGSEVTTTIDGSTCAPCPEVTTPAPETTTSCPTPQPDVDYCSENPCENGGTCVNTTGTYHCDCSNNWVGQNCTEGMLFGNKIRAIQRY